MVNKLGRPLLAGCSPAEQVGAGVRPRIKALLLSGPDFQKILSDAVSRETDAKLLRPSDRQYALEVLTRLRQGIDDVKREVLGIGHNNPPGSFSSESERRVAFDGVQLNIAAIESETGKPALDGAAVAAPSEWLIRFGVKIAAWLGRRTTKFADVALAAPTPAFVLKVTGLLPILLEALSALARAVPH